MLKIRSDQMKAFQSVALQRFEERMISHLERFAPKHCRVLGESGIREVIRLGEQRARAHGLTSERSARLYIEMMLLLDSGFDTDPQIQWAGAMLLDQTSGSELERMDCLYDKAWDYVEHVAADYVGKSGNIDPIRLVDRIHQIIQEREHVLDGPAIPQFQERIAARLFAAFPSKCRYIGERSLHGFIEHSLFKARHHSVTTEYGTSIFVISGFILGAGFDCDPQLPWIPEILSGSIEQNTRADRLLDGVIVSFKHWWT